MKTKYQVKVCHGIYATYIFRKEPVPTTGKRTSYFKSYYRIPKTYNERKKYYSCENKKLIRGKRREKKLWFAFDDIVRNVYRSWKSNTKYRKQHSFNQKLLRKLKYNQEY